MQLLAQQINCLMIADLKSIVNNTNNELFDILCH